jgi:hypothetical protein
MKDDLYRLIALLICYVRSCNDTTNSSTPSYSNVYRHYMQRIYVKMSLRFLCAFFVLPYIVRVYVLSECGPTRKGGVAGTWMMGITKMPCAIAMLGTYLIDITGYIPPW